MTENKPLIIPELVALDADAGPGKEDVIEVLAATGAGAGRASSPDGLAADAKKRESTAPTGIPGGLARPPGPRRPGRGARPRAAGAGGGEGGRGAGGGGLPPPPPPPPRTGPPSRTRPRHCARAGDTMLR